MTSAHQPSVDDWDDDYVFEQFSSSDLRYRPDPLTSSSSRFLGASRSEIVRAKIASLEAAIAADKASLQADLRLARHLAICSPFLSSTRARIQDAVDPLARRVRATRLSVCRNVLMREVLARDLLAEEREAQRARQQPRSAMTRTRSERPPSPAVSATDEDAADLWRRPSRTRMRRSMTDGGLAMVELASLPGGPSRSETPTTATTSVHPGREDRQRMEGEDRDDEEEATPWEATRAGKRVSLVHVDLPAVRAPGLHSEMRS